MAERRMFTKKIVDSDFFLDMPLSSQALYFHLSMRADDEGFVNNPKKIQRMIGASDDDMKVLVAKKFILVFESGVIVIKHWRMHNYIQNDRFHPTAYTEERAMLTVKDNRAYTMAESVEIPTLSPECIQDGYKLDTEIRLDKNSQEESIRHEYGEFKNILLTDEELNNLKERFPIDWKDRIENCSTYIKSTGKHYDSHYATILSWANKEKKNEPPKPRYYSKAEKAEEVDAVQMPEEMRARLSEMFGGV